MKTEDKSLAEMVLRRLCQGAQIDGIRFGPILQLLITDHASQKPLIQGQIYLNLDSRWTVFETFPIAWPECEVDLPELSVHEQLKMLCDLREALITDIVLGDKHPHLHLHLEDGRVLFANGCHDQYECWELGVAWGKPGDCWLVVACPGDGVAVWSAESIEQASNSALLYRTP